MKRIIKIASAAGVLTLGLAAAHAQDKTFLTMDSFPAGTTPGQFGIAFTQIVQKHLPIEIQVSVGKPAPKSAIDAAKGKVDLFLSAPTINFNMQTRTAMFAKVADAPELNKELRSILSYPLGPYHIIVYEDSGIRSLQDFKGRKVFLGPPAGAATKVAMQIMEAATSLKPEQDYELVRFDWQSAETAFLDRQMDAYVVPTTLPSPSVQQFGLVSKIRILGIPPEAWDKPSMKEAMGLPGRTVVTIPKNLYQNQVNEEDVKTIGSWVGLGVRKGVDEKIVYQMTKALWENIGDLHQTAEWMKTITRETAFQENNIPLHAGAYRYYKEAGFDVPADQVPPEAK